jgi:hypothetical protein
MASLAHPHHYGFGIPNGLEMPPAGDFAPQSNHSPNDSHLKRNGLTFSAAMGHHHQHPGSMMSSGMQGGAHGGPGQEGHIKRCVKKKIDFLM